MWPSVFRTQKYEGTQTEKKTLPPAFDMIGILGSLPLGNAKRVEKEKIDIFIMHRYHFSCSGREGINELRG